MALPNVQAADGHGEFNEQQQAGSHPCRRRHRARGHAPGRAGHGLALGQALVLLRHRQRLVGGASYEAHGTPLTDETLADAVAADAVLFGAVGGPQWDDVARDVRPEMGILRLRKEMDLYANLRPALVFDPLVEASTLKDEVVRGLDLMIVRELTGGIYFGEPRGVETLPDGTRRGFDTEVYSSPEIERVCRVAFELARRRDSRVHSVEKANVMESGKFWRDEVTALHAADYADIALEHMYADNCAMQLVRRPKQFDVIVTSNLFGDLLSDCAAMLTGSLGMLPSASLGPSDESGNRKALYEPVHGSAPTSPVRIWPTRWQPSSASR